VSRAAARESQVSGFRSQVGLRTRNEKRGTGHLLLVLLGLLGGCTVGPIQPVEPVTLAYGGAEGVTSRYELKQMLKGRMALGGMPQLMVVRMRARVEEKVERVAADGRRLVRIVYAFSPPVINGMAFKSGDLPQRIEVLVLRAPSGETEQLNSDAVALGFQDLALRVLGLSLPLLPRAGVVPGEEWEREWEIPAPGGGGFRAIASGALLEMEPREGAEGGVARLAVKGEVRLARPGERAALEKFELDYSGKSRFAVAEGRLIESRQSGMIRMKGRAGDLPVSARLRFTTVLKPVTDF